ncbi:MAG: peptidoglycan-associated lipoprotein Pal [Deltaproteobacteria bacterium]|nr:peptidoglycan-associated lipoprotein Pal [Deltaproteobacteria bacterium]
MVTLVLSGCCCPKKKAVESELPTTTVAQAPEVKEATPPAPTVAEEPLETLAKKAGALEIIYFDFDKSTIKPQAKEKLDRTAKWLTENPTVNVQVEGNCDERGTNEYNLALGDRRAASAKKYLANLGIAPARITTISYGEEKPADPGHDESAWALNRRDEFKITGK